MSSPSQSQWLHSFFISPFLSFELFLRRLTIYSSRLFSTYSQMLSLIYVYCVLQLVGIVWAFMTNLALALGLKLAEEVGRGALEFTESTWRKREILATVYVVYATFRVVFKFMQKSVYCITQSMNDFPRARSKIVRMGGRSPGKGERLFVLLLGTFLPHLVVSLSLVFTQHLDCRTDGRSHLMRDTLCHDLPFQYISKSYVLPRKILSLTLLLSLIQYSIVLLNQFPSWSKAFR